MAKEFYQVFKIEVDNDMRNKIAAKAGVNPKDITESDVRRVIKELVEHAINVSGE